MLTLLWWFALLPGAQASELKGRVSDANTREALSKAALRALPDGPRTETTGSGDFVLSDPPAPPFALLVTCVGYKPLRVNVTDPSALLEISLTPDTLRRTESVNVSAGPFAIDTPSSVSLAGSELRNLASVLADDPLRAMQGLPGVNANDDFSAQITLRGSGPQRVGVYLDGVLLHSPYHTLQGDSSGASLTLLSADLLEQAELHPGPIPAQFADRSAGAVDLRMREGDRKKIVGRAAASMSNASMSLEGPIGHKEKGSWLVSARKSYLQYLIGRTSDLPSIAFGFWDVQGRLAYDLARNHTATISIVHGSSGLDRKGAENTVSNNGYFYSNYDYTLARIGSRYTPHPSLMLNSIVSFTREQYDNLNKFRDPLSTDHYGEWAANFDHTWMFSEKNGLLFGANLRRMRDNGTAWRRLNNNTSQVLDIFQGTGLRSGVHAAPQFNFFGGKLAIRAGGRADHHEVNGRTVFSPSAEMTITPWRAGTLHFGWGHAAQFPELLQFYSRSGSTRLAEERSSHLAASFEQRLDERTRFRAEAYSRTDRNLIDRPLYYPHYTGTRIIGGDLAARYYNTLRGYSRGMSFFLQRRTANGLTGWISYSYSISKMRDDFNHLRLPADYDQRHTANLFLSYRLRPTVNLSSRWVYGSGFPVPGYFERAPPGQQNVFLSPSRNALRLPQYHRWDIRANKTFVKRGFHITLYAELINVYNHSNIRFEDLSSWDGRTGAARLSLAKMFPILPSAGMAVEF